MTNSRYVFRVAAAIGVVLLSGNNGWGAPPDNDVGESESLQSSFQLSERITAIDEHLARQSTNDASQSSRARSAAVWRRLDATLRRVEARTIAGELFAAEQRDRFALLVDRVRASVKRLESEDSTLAAKFKGRLSVLESSWTKGSVELPSDESPLIQWIHDWTDPADSESTEDVDEPKIVRVKNELPRPALLVLTGSRKTTWHIENGDSAHVRAVVVGLNNDVKCDSPALVFRRRFGLGLPTLQQMQAWQRIVLDEFGDEADILTLSSDSTKDVLLSPANEKWVRAYLLGQLEALHAETRAAQNSFFRKREPDLRFRGVTAQFNGNVQTFITTSEFDLMGPVDETKRPSKRPLWNRISTSETSGYVLEFTGRLLRWTEDGAQQQKWAHAELPLAWASGRSLRSITYDRSENRLFGLGETGDLFVLDIKNSKWTRIGPSPAGSIGITYQSDTDSILVLRQRPDLISKSPKWTTTLLRLGVDGKQIDEQLLDCVDLMQDPYSKASNELTLTERYLIALQPPSSGQRHPAEAVIRIFDLSTGEMVYDHQMEPEVGVAKYASLPKNIKPTRYAVLRRKLVDLRDRLEKETKDGDSIKALGERLDVLAQPEMVGDTNSAAEIVDGDTAVKEFLAQLDALAKEAGLSAP